MVNIAKHTTHVMTGKAIGPAAGCLQATTQMDHEATKIKNPEPETSGAVSTPRMHGPSFELRGENDGNPLVIHW